MIIPPKQSESIFYQKLKWLMFFRILLTVLLLGSTIVLQLGESSSPIAKPLLVLYGLIAGIFFISFIYAIIIRYIKREMLFAYIQAGIDTFIVTLIIFVTGGYTSVFSFLSCYNYIFKHACFYAGKHDYSISLQPAIRCTDCP